MIDALNADSDFSKLFTASGDNTGIIITSVDTGLDAPAVTDFTTDDATGTIAAGTGTAGVDAFYSVDMSTLAVGDTVTVHGKTYEFVASEGDEAEGNIGVVFTANIAGSLDAFNEALGEDGIVAEKCRRRQLL
jgi:hypothetical protein